MHMHMHMHIIAPPLRCLYVLQIYLSKSLRKTLLESRFTSGLEETEETALEIYDFLLACRERMLEIIDAGTLGLLSCTLLARCISINEQLLNEIGSYSVRDEGEREACGSSGRRTLFRGDDPEPTQPAKPLPGGFPSLAVPMSEGDGSSSGGVSGSEDNLPGNPM